MEAFEGVSNNLTSTALGWLDLWRLLLYLWFTKLIVMDGHREGQSSEPSTGSAKRGLS
jgi:hypothetical protein|tara:strand:+ start:488 stop:661 length:174 start_codon:yes stop_codon:yes gene_type:complete